MKSVSRGVFQYTEVTALTFACRIPSSKLLNAATTPSEPVVTTGLRGVVCGAVGDMAGFSVPVGCCPADLVVVPGVVERGRAGEDVEFVFCASVTGPLIAIAAASIMSRKHVKFSPYAV